MEKNVVTNQYRRELKPRILGYAMEQFMIHGIRNVKMDTLAKDLGISKRTMYELFENKEDLLLEGLRYRQGVMDEKLKSMAMKEGTTVIDILAEYFRIQMFHVSRFNPVIYDEMNRYERIKAHIHMERERMKSSALRFFNRGVEEGFFRSDINYELVSRVCSISIEQAMLQQLYKEYSMSDLVKNMMFLYLRAVCTVKGVERLDKLIIC